MGVAHSLLWAPGNKPYIMIGDLELPLPFNDKAIAINSYLYLDH